MGYRILIERLGQEFERVTQVFNSFHVIDVFLYPLKALENLWFSNICRRYRKIPVVLDGLKSLFAFLYWWHLINTNWHHITGWKVFKYGVSSGPYFPAFGLNMEIYSVNLRIQSEYRKIRTRKNSTFGHFSHSACFQIHGSIFPATS